MEATCPRCGKFCSETTRFCDVCGVDIQGLWKASPPAWFRPLAEVPWQVRAGRPAPAPAPTPPRAPAREQAVSPAALAGGGGFAGAFEEEPEVAPAPRSSVGTLAPAPDGMYDLGSGDLGEGLDLGGGLDLGSMGAGGLDLAAAPGADGAFDLGGPGPDGAFDLGGADLGFGSSSGAPSSPGDDGVFDLGGGSSGGFADLDLGGPPRGRSPMPSSGLDLSGGPLGHDLGGGFDLGGGGDSGPGVFASGGLDGLDLGGASLPGLDLGAQSMPGLDLGAQSMPGLDLGGSSLPGLDLGGGSSRGFGADMLSVESGPTTGLQPALGTDSFGGLDFGSPLDQSIPGMTDDLGSAEDLALGLQGSRPAARPPAGGQGEFATLAFDPSASREELPTGLGRSAAPPAARPAPPPFQGLKAPPQIDDLVVSSPNSAGSSPEVDFSALADGGLEGFGPSSGEVDFSSLSSLGDKTLGDNPFESMSLADFSSADLGGATGEVDFSAIADGASLEGLENSMDFSGLSSLEFVPPSEGASAGSSGEAFSLDGGGTDVYDLDDNALSSGEDELLKASLLNYKPPRG